MMNSGVTSVRCDTAVKDESLRAAFCDFSCCILSRHLSRSSSNIVASCSLDSVSSSYWMDTSCISAFSRFSLTLVLLFSMNTICWCIASKRSAVVRMRFGLFLHSGGIMMLSRLRSGYRRCRSVYRLVYGL